MKAHYSKHGCYTCILCGKQTRQTTESGEESDAELCRRCFEECERENSEADNQDHSITQGEGK